MSTAERIRDRGRRRGRRALTTVADEFREKRIATGLSQSAVAAAAGISRPTYSRIENAQFSQCSVQALCLVASALGLDVSIRVFPGPEPLRDGASLARLERVLSQVGPPLSYRTEVPLPQSEKSFEQRAWDAVIFGHGRRTAIEMEMRIRDAQALERRMNLKRQADPVEAFILLVAHTRHNTAVLGEYPTLFPGLARLTFRELARQLRSGQHPPSSLVLC